MIRRKSEYPTERKKFMSSMDGEHVLALAKGPYLGTIPPIAVPCRVTVHRLIRDGHVDFPSGGCRPQPVIHVANALGYAARWIHWRERE